jgi:hypothetical protein
MQSTHPHLLKRSPPPLLPPPLISFKQRHNQNHSLPLSLSLVSSCRSWERSWRPGRATRRRRSGR